MKKQFLFLLISFICWHHCYATIDIRIKAPGYIVFASDGRIINDSLKIVMSDTYQKICSVNNYIMVQMGETSHPANKDLVTTIQDFKWKKEISDTAKIDAVFPLFRQYCQEVKDIGGNYLQLNLWFAGPDAKGNLQIYRYIPRLDSLETNERYDIYYSGVGTFCSRLLNGIDNVLEDILISKLAQDSPRNAQLCKKAIDLFKPISQEVIQRMPVNDAVSVAYDLVRITITMDKFFEGRPTTAVGIRTPKTGGDISICVVTHDGIQWALRPNLFDGKLELQEIK